MIHKQKYKFYAAQFTLEYRWRKDGCDWTLDYKTITGWTHFGLVCTHSLKYVWGPLPSYNFGDSVKTCKNKLLQLCAESLAIDYTVVKKARTI